MWQYRSGKNLWRRNKYLGLFRPGNGREAVGKLLVNDHKFTNIEEVNCHVYVWVKSVGVTRDKSQSPFAACQFLPHRLYLCTTLTSVFELDSLLLCEARDSENIDVQT